MKTFAVAVDLLREARSRKWFLGLGIAITGVLVTLGFSLKMDVVDGALAATHLFGKEGFGPMGPADVMLRPVFSAASQVIFYGGLLFGIFSCSDFAPKLLSPGRIEHLLSLPVRRWELLLGTFLGVLTMAWIGAGYGAGGLVLILGVKSGYWTARPLVAAMLAGVSFASIYAAMLAVALFVRSAAMSAATGGILFVAGIVASYRHKILPMFEPGFGRGAFRAVTSVLPRVAALADTSAQIAGSGHYDHPALWSLLAGLLLFACSVLALAIWRFEQKDF